MKIIALADTHKQYFKMTIPECDLFIHAGDIDVYRYDREFDHFNEWLLTIPAKERIVIAGNHDGYFEDKNPFEIKKMLTNGTYLFNDSCRVGKYKIWGSPYTPRFGNWSFMYRTVEEAQTIWSMIPEDTDIVITHGPPVGILDKVEYPSSHVGCYWLRKKIFQIKPKLHIFGHIHQSRGMEIIDGITFMNVSVIDENFEVTFKPMEIEL